MPLDGAQPADDSSRSGLRIDHRVLKVDALLLLAFKPDSEKARAEMPASIYTFYSREAVQRMLDASGFCASRYRGLCIRSPTNIVHGACQAACCKNLEGAIFPFQVESLENGVNDSIHALHVHKANHGPGAAPDFGLPRSSAQLMLVVRNFFHRDRGKTKNESSSGRSRSSCRTRLG